ncbi:type IX secretion system outer membrane channel protein PorV [Neolewinella lacunae]|uniref:Type IX secretion system outer membrane channel protein PorV n=1 Tax=Neolewinella lacunae TaxID=1517758 RepID=A0A923PJL8_9BACT|nr:type IX secretion system outer membrane channel protein PorV [Neolewinella lacunae]MBC6995282.1 type IX secretion system outer membrane channel protein PorV [Neolewinella lacunae]MDN3635548.1 type IX secretion system outer membrane channel protein PorV [Neolewinella lacunae]
MQRILLNSLCALALCGLSFTLAAQGACVLDENGRAVQPGTGGPCINTVVSAVPFLRINPDARGGAMGDAGVALSGDANSLHYNASRLAFAEEDLALGATYTPWLQALGLNDVYLAYLGGYKKLDEFQAVGASLRYFSLGDIQYTDVNGMSTGTGKPNEFEFALAYTRKLSDRFSASLTGKYINSNLAAGQEVSGVVLEAGQAFAADLGFTYRNDDTKNNNAFAIGAAITNIGSKITYTQDTVRDFLPANLAIGTAYTFRFDEYNELTLTFDANKLLVPTPCDGTDVDCDQDEINDKSPIAGIFSSLNDAPQGFGEELREFTLSVGAEYWYDKQFAVRAGYFHEDQTKGGRRYLTAGLGLKYNIFGLNFSYLVPTSNQRNPLDNTLRFSLLFDFGAQQAR